MAIFAEVALQWGEQRFTIPADQVLAAIAVVEDVLTLGDLARTGRGRVPLAKISMAYGAVLRYAGAKVTDEEVYSAMFSAKAAEIQKRATEAIFALEVLMIPPEHLRVAKGQPGPKAGANGEERAASSPSATSSSSAPPG